jgi:glycosyltransferase involved in cell wall biosynthesis
MLMKTKSIEPKWHDEQAVDLTGLLSNEQRAFKVSVVIPTINEAENLAYVLPGIQQWVDEVVLVDGHSSDDTVDVARQLYPSIRVVMQEGPGKGTALRTGFAAATGDIIIMLDADGSTDPSEIPLFIGALLSGADFAKGSRFLQGGGTEDMPFYRKLGNWGFVQIVRLLFGGKYTDLCYGYNAFWKRVLPLLDLDCSGFEVETMMNVRALKAGLQITEVPSFEFERVHGKGRLKTIPDGWRVLKTIFREARNRGELLIRSQSATRGRRVIHSQQKLPLPETNSQATLDSQ